MLLRLTGSPPGLTVTSKGLIGAFRAFCSSQLSARRVASGLLNKGLLASCHSKRDVQNALLRSARSYSTEAATDEDELPFITGGVGDSLVENALLGADMPTLLINDDSPFLYRCYGHLLDFAHTTLGLPWWLSVATSAVGIRLLLFPFVTLSNQRNNSLYHNAIPDLLRHHLRISQARVQIDLKKIFEEEGKLALYSEQAKLAPIGAQLVNISISVTAFATQFFALRKLALLHCEGFDAGGALWFLDLTTKDPLLTLVTSFTYFLWMLIRMEQSVRIGGPHTVTAMVGRVTVGSLTIGSLFVFGSMPSAVLCFCVTDFGLNTALAMLYGTETYRNLFRISHPIVLSNPTQEGYVDLPEQVEKGYESSMGKIRAVRRANIAAVKSSGHGFLLYDADEIKEFFKKWLFNLGSRKDRKNAKK